MKNTAS